MKSVTLVGILAVFAVLGCSSCSDNGSGEEPETVVDTVRATESVDDSSLVDSGSDSEPSGTSSSSADETDEDTRTAGTTSQTGPDTESGTETSDCVPTVPEVGGNYNLPQGCEVVAASASISAGGKGSIDGKSLIWGDYDEKCKAHIVVVRDLETKQNRIVDVDFSGHQDNPRITGDIAIWHKEAVKGEWLSRELYMIDIASSGEPTKITSDNCADATVGIGTRYVVYRKTCSENEEASLWYSDITAKTSKKITDDAVSPPAPMMAFDGERYVAWRFEESMFVYDIQNPQVPKPVETQAIGFGWPDVYNGKVYAGASSPEWESRGFDMWEYDIKTGAEKWLSEEVYDQLNPAADGKAVVYLDTSTLGETWFNAGSKSQVEIMDLETKVTRQITLSPERYYGPGLVGKYLTFGAQAGGDKVVLCDLEAGGFIDEHGNVIPEGGAK